VCLVGVRGRVFEIGDAQQEFTVQSISKLFVFAAVCDLLGPDEARHQLGVNSTGLPFDSVMGVELNEDRTMNPMVNAGALATTIDGTSLKRVSVKGLSRRDQGRFRRMLARRPAAVHRDDGLAKGDVVQRVRSGGDRPATGRNAFVKVDQLLLEALVERRDLFGPR